MSEPEKALEKASGIVGSLVFTTIVIAIMVEVLKPFLIILGIIFCLAITIVVAIWLFRMLHNRSHFF